MSSAPTNPNTVAVLPAAISTIVSFPFGIQRRGISVQEYNTYRQDWVNFNNVWSYNYTISTLNSSGTSYSRYFFVTRKDYVSYINGQQSHVSYFKYLSTLGTGTVPAYWSNAGQFNDI